jgi:hypothetical protein
MAIKKIKVPFCDVCHKPWLPKFLLDDGTPNPAFLDPTLCPRCGKCKSTRWNAAGVDRRRKAVVESPAEVPQVTMQDVEQTIDAMPMPVIPEEVFQYAENMMKGAQILCGSIAEVKGRCRHGLYSCPECHPQEAA